MAKKFPSIKNKTVWKLERPIDVDGQQSTLTVKVDFNIKTATWKISGFLTTKQVDPSSQEVTEGTLDTLSKMIAQATEEAIEYRRELLESRDGDRDQLEIPLGEPEGAAAGPGNR